MSIQKAVLKAGLKRRKQFNTISSHGVADKKKKSYITSLPQPPKMAANFIEAIQELVK